MCCCSKMIDIIVGVRHAEHLQYGEYVVNFPIIPVVSANQVYFYKLILLKKSYNYRCKIIQIR